MHDRLQKKKSEIFLEKENPPIYFGNVWKKTFTQIVGFIVYSKNFEFYLNKSYKFQLTVLIKYKHFMIKKEFIKMIFYLAAHITVLFKIYLLSQKNLRQPDFKNVSIVLANKEQKLIACMKKVKKMKTQSFVHPK